MQARVHTWDKLEADRPMDLIERKRIIGKHVMLSHVHLAKGFKVPTHAHDNEQMAVCLTGRTRFVINEGAEDETTIELTAGQVLELPSGVPHSAEALEDTLIIDVFSPPSEKTGIDR